MTENKIAAEVVDAAYQMHTRLGPGLLETVSQIVLTHELRKRGLRVEREVPVRIEYDGVKFEEVDQGRDLSRGQWAAGGVDCPEQDSSLTRRRKGAKACNKNLFALSRLCVSPLIRYNPRVAHQAAQTMSPSFGRSFRVDGAFHAPYLRKSGR